MSEYSVLIVDDDEALCELLSQYLTKEGLQVHACHDGVAALAFLESEKSADVMVLDIMMPGMSGLELLQKIRINNSIPVIMLTGRGDDIDRIVGLEMGADDYLGKPCNPRELLARIHAILRRTRLKNPSPESPQPIVNLNSLAINSATLSASVNGVDLKLTGAEFKVLELLSKNIGHVVSKQQLTQEVLHRELSAYDRSIDVHVSRVRQKLVSQDMSRIAIKTVRGQGYMLVEDA